MKFILTLLVGLYSFGNSFSQDELKFYFRNTLSKAEGIDYSLASRHFLGETISQKMYLFQSTYTYIEKGTPMSPADKTIVRKPVIFYAIKKLNNHYKSQLKKGTATEQELITRFSQILDAAYCMYAQNTDDFEVYLKHHKKPDDIEKAFLAVVLN